MAQGFLSDIRSSRAGGVIILFFIILIPMVVLGLERIKTRTEKNTQQILLYSMENSHAAVLNWVENLFETMTLLNRNSDVRRNVLSLLDAYQRGEKLQNNNSLEHLRSYYKPWIEAHSARGFFIFAPDGISIASMRDHNIGIMTRVSQITHQFEKCFKGDPELVLPFASQIALPNIHGEKVEGEPTMFAAIPVRGLDDTVMAVFAIRLDPTEDFSAITHISRVGITGDTYLFNRDARLITRTRFDDMLRTIGLVGPEKQALLSLRIADPGRNSAIRAENVNRYPLTLMAKEAVKGESGMNIDGYRDYRGIRVVGTWKWDETHNFGITSEIDLSEAYGSYLLARFIVVGALSFIGVLFSAFVLVVERKNRITVENEKKLKRITNTVQDAIVLIDTRGRIQFWNSSAARIFGVSEEKAIGKDLHELISPKRYKPMSDAGHKAYVKTGKGPIVGNLREVQALSADGTEFPVELAVQALNINSEWWAVGSVRDISSRKQDEKRLSEITERFELATKSANLGIWDWDVRNNKLVWDDAMYNMYGVENDKFKGAVEAWEQCVHPDDSVRAKKELDQALEGIKPFDTKYRIVLPDQSIRYIKADGTVKFDDKGNAIRITGVNYDMTLQMEAEIALQNFNLELEQKVRERTTELETAKQGLERSEERFRGLVESCSDIIWGQDENGRVTYISPKVAEVLGYDQKEMIGDRFLPLSESNTSKQKVHSNAAVASFENIQHEFVNKCNQKAIAFETNISPVVSKDGAHMGFRGISRDITERKIQSETLRKLLKAVEASPVSVIITNTEGIIEYANRFCLSISGYPKKELIGRTPGVFKSGRHPASFYQQLWSTISKGEQWEGDICNRKKDHTEFWERVLISPIFNEDDMITHYVAVKDDITEKKKTEEELNKALVRAESATLAKSDFLANMSHEIRTPMNAIIGMTHLALETNLDSRQLDYIQKVDMSAKSLLTIINDILDFSKIEAGKLTIEQTKFNLRETIENVIILSAEKIAKKDIDLFYSVDDHIPAVLVGDPVRVGQIFTNLLSNAVKFIEKGSIDLTARVKSRDGSDLIVECKVQDTGIGMTKEQADRLFEKFSQADTSITRKYGGTGLGLSIVHRLVGLMGGTIGVDTQPDKGTTFTFTLKTGFKKDRRKEQFSLRLPPDLDGLKVLVVHPKQVFLDRFGQMGGQFPFQTLQMVNQLDRGLEYLEGGQNSGGSYDILFLDIEQASDFMKIGEWSHLPVIVIPDLMQNRGVGPSIQNRMKTVIMQMPLNPHGIFNSIMTLFGYPDLVFRRRENTIENIFKKLEPIRGAKILLVEDNELNRQVALGLLEKINARVVIAHNGAQALERLSDDAFDLILMDIQMPVMDGTYTARAIRKQGGDF